MLQKYGKNRLTSKQLLNHDFIIGDYHTFCRVDNNNNNFNHKNINIQIVSNNINPPRNKKIINSNPNYNHNFKDKFDINNDIYKKYICIGCGDKINDIKFKCSICHSLIFVLKLDIKNIIILS